jgi:gliding motility-associated-like protein
MKNKPDKNNASTLACRVVCLLAATLLFSGAWLSAQPSAPGNLYVIAGDRQNEIHWTKTGSPDMLEYKVYRSLDSSSFSLIGSIPSQDDVYLDNNLINGLFYFYRITAVNKGNQESQFSNTDAGVPSAGLDRYLNLGSNSYLKIDDNKNLNIKTGSFSVECWVKLSDTTSTRTIFSRQDNTKNTIYYQLKYAKGQFIVVLNDTSVVFTLSSQTVISPNQWYHVALVYNDANVGASRSVNLYVNGQLAASKSNIASAGEGNKKSVLLLGAQLNANGVSQNYLNGDIKEVRLWNIALTSTAIQANMALFLRGDEAGMLGLWHCNGVFHNVVYDNNPLGDNAVAYGGPVVLPNHPPVFVNNTGEPVTMYNVSGYEDSALHVHLFLRDIDGDKITLTSAAVLSGKGVVSGIPSADSSFTYKTPKDYFGKDTLKVIAVDNSNSHQTASLVLVLEIQPVNDPPVFIDNRGNHILVSNASTLEDTPAKLHLLVSDVDKDLVYISQVKSLNGKGNIEGLMASDTSFTYLPKKDVNGVDTLLVIAQDNNAPVGYDTLKLIMNITPVNDSPVILDRSGKPVTFMVDSARAGEPRKICLSLYDVDGDKPRIINSITSNNGKISIKSDSCFAYTSNAGFRGTDQFRLIVSDMQTPPLYDTLVVYMNVTKINNAPVVLNNNGQDAYYLADTINENTQGQICLKVFDKDNDWVSISSITSLTGQTQPVIVPGSILCLHVNPAKDFYGNDSLKIVVADNGDPVMYDSAVLKLNVKHINRPPVIVNPIGQHLEIIEKTIDMNRPGDLCLFVQDPENDPSEITFGESLHKIGTVEYQGIETNCFKYYPRENFVGNDTLLIVVSDKGIPSLSDSVKVVFHILAAKANTPPVIVDSKNNPVDTIQCAINEGETLETCLTMIDPDNNDVAIHDVSLIHGKGSILFGKSCFTFMAVADYVGVSELFVKVKDNGYPSLSDSAVVIITIKPKLSIAQGFSPDNDGVNDFWKIEGIEKYPDNTVVIFNQSGEIVCKIKGYDNINNVWNGQTKGRQVNEKGEALNGTYFYVIDIAGVPNKISGFIIVKR